MMDKCLQLLSLFNKRSKLICLNGYTHFQILNELKSFHELQNDSDIPKIDSNNTIFNPKNDKLQFDRKIEQHYCNDLYFDNNLDELFSQIYAITKDVNLERFEELSQIDELLDNPRINNIKDITLSAAISIYLKPFNGTKIDKNQYLNLISSILEDCNNNITDNKEDNLLLFENAFSNLDYAIPSVKERVEIYQELIILICKLTQLYDLDAGLLLEYLNIYIFKVVKDLTYLNDNDLTIRVVKSVYSNTGFGSFFIFFPFFLENYSPKIIKQIVEKFEKDSFIKKDENYYIIKNILIFSSGDVDSYLKAISDNEDINDFGKDLSLLEFSINFEEKEQVKFYWEKVVQNEDYFGYDDIISDLKEIVDNFDRIEKLENNFKKLSKDTLNQLLIESEQLNYLNRQIYSCAVNRVYYAFFDKKTFDFDFLLVLINLGLSDKASIYFYHNINYIDFKKDKAEDIFKYANMLFFINCFDFAAELLTRLYSNLLHKKNKQSATLLSYIILELNLMKNLLIPLLNDKDWDDILK